MKTYHFQIVNNSQTKHKDPQLNKNVKKYKTKYYMLQPKGAKYRTEITSKNATYTKKSKFGYTYSG